jgi:hypothetical protein
MTAPLDRERLEQIVRTLARLHLEVERGLRSKDTFARQMPPSARLAYLRAQTPDTRLAAGSVTDADIRNVRTEPHQSGRIYATAITSTTRGRSGALTFVLETRDDKVALLQVTRLQTRGDYTQRHTNQLPDSRAVSDRQRHIIRDSRDHADAVRRDLTRRLENRPKSDPGRPGLQRDHETWTKLYEYYDDQYRQLHDQARQRSPNPIRDRRRF